MLINVLILISHYNMLSNFYDHTCTIYSETLTVSWWEQVLSENIIYNNIPCYFYNKNWNIRVRELETEKQVSNIRCNISSDKSEVRIWQRVKINDPLIWNIWVFEISDISVNRFIHSWDDSITLFLRQLENA